MYIYNILAYLYKVIVHLNFTKNHKKCSYLFYNKLKFLPLTPRGGSLMPPGRVTAPGILKVATLLLPLNAALFFVFVSLSA